MYPFVLTAFLSVGSSSCRIDFLLTMSYRLFLLMAFSVPLFVMLLIYIRIFIVIKRNEFVRKSLRERLPLETRITSTFPAAPSQVSNQDKIGHHYKDHQLRDNDHTSRDNDVNENETVVESNTENNFVREVSLVNSMHGHERLGSSKPRQEQYEPNGTSSQVHSITMASNETLRRSLRDPKSCLIHFKWFNRAIPRSGSSKDSFSTEVSMSTNGSLIHRYIVPELDPPTEDSTINYSVKDSPEFSPLTTSRINSDRNRRNRMYINGQVVNSSSSRRNHNHSNTRSFVLRRSQSHSKALFTTLIILGTYLFCWMPAVVFLALTCQDGCPFPVLSISPMVKVMISVICNALVILKAVVDPFIYTLRMKEVKMAIRRMRGK